MSVENSISAPTTTVKRRSTGKRLRFEVFKRDYFTCRYCGAQPPDAILVIDHVVPLALGGASSAENYVTACEPCNQGKSDRGLGDVPPRTDADLLYLTTQQEIAEMRRYQAAVAAKEDALSELVVTMQDLWVTESGLDWHPSDRIIKPLLRKYDMEIVGEAIMDVAPKVGTGYIKNSKWIAYLHAVCRNMAAEQEGS